MVVIAAVTVNVAVTITVITAVVVAATNVESIATATVASAAAIVATFLLQLTVDCCFVLPAEGMILSAPPLRVSYSQPVLRVPYSQWVALRISYSQQAALKV